MDSKKDIKQTAAKYRSRYQGVSLEDLSWYLVAKVDTIAEQTAQNTTSIEYLKWGMGTISVALFGLIAAMLSAT